MQRDDLLEDLSRLTWQELLVQLGTEMRPGRLVRLYAEQMRRSRQRFRDTFRDGVDVE